MTKDYYKTLGVSKSASQDEIKKVPIFKNMKIEDPRQNNVLSGLIVKI